MEESDASPTGADWRLGTALSLDPPMRSSGSIAFPTIGFTDPSDASRQLPTSLKDPHSDQLPAIETLNTLQRH